MKELNHSLGIWDLSIGLYAYIWSHYPMMTSSVIPFSCVHSIDVFKPILHNYNKSILQARFYKIPYLFKENKNTCRTKNLFVRKSFVGSFMKTNKLNNITRCKLKQNENRNLENLIIKYNTFFFEMLVVFFHSFNVNTKKQECTNFNDKNFPWFETISL